jgi:hypothetical protein
MTRFLRRERKQFPAPRILCPDGRRSDPCLAFLQDPEPRDLKREARPAEMVPSQKAWTFRTEEDSHSTVSPFSILRTWYVDFPSQEGHLPGKIGRSEDTRTGGGNPG